MSSLQSLIDSLARKTRLAMLRKKGRFGRDYDWNPRPNLVRRVSRELGINEEEAYDRLIAAKQYVRAHPQYYR